MSRVLHGVRACRHTEGAASPLRRFVGIDLRGPIPESNYTVGREANAIDLIVDHWTVVMFEGAIRRFKDPTSRLSAHYVIGQDGRIAQLVSEDDTAYHAGRYEVNLRWIGIEHEASPMMAPTDALYAASAQLHLEIANRYGLALEAGSTVLPHRAIVPTECPGTLDLERIVREATEEDDMFTEEDRRKLDRVYQHLEAYEPLVWTRRRDESALQRLKRRSSCRDLRGPDRLAVACPWAIRTGTTSSRSPGIARSSISHA
jgi:hypothetical protein